MDPAKKKKHKNTKQIPPMKLLKKKSPRKKNDIFTESDIKFSIKVTTDKIYVLS